MKRSLCYFALAIHLTLLPFSPNVVASPRLCEWAIESVDQAAFKTQVARLAEAKEVEEIGMFEFRRVESPQVCMTCSIGCCTGLVIINRRTNVAYIGHFVHDGPNPKVLVDLASSEAQSGKDLEVIITGGQVPAALHDPDYAHYREETKRFNDALVKAVHGAGVSPRRVRNLTRLEPDTVTFGLLVDPESKRVFVLKYEDDAFGFNQPPQ